MTRSNYIVVRWVKNLDGTFKHVLVGRVEERYAGGFNLILDPRKLPGPLMRGRGKGCREGLKGRIYISFIENSERRARVKRAKFQEDEPNDNTRRTP